MKPVFLTLYLLILCLHTQTAQAHSPYFQDYSDWNPSEGQEYHLQGWYGDGIFAADPVRIVLRHRNGGISAVADMGTQASGFCPSLDFCWGFTFGPFGVLPQIWRLNPDKMEKIPAPKEENSFNYPEHWGGGASGFDTSWNYLMLPVAWVTLLQLLLKSGMSVILVVTLPVFFVFLIFRFGFEKLRKITPSSQINRLLRWVGLSFLIALMTGAIALSVFIAAFYGAGLLVIPPFIIWKGVEKMYARSFLSHKIFHNIYYVCIL